MPVIMRREIEQKSNHPYVAVPLAFLVMTENSEWTRLNWDLTTQDGQVGKVGSRHFEDGTDD